MPPSQDPRAKRSRHALRTALMALLDRKSFDQISIRDITKEAGVGYATFFRHLPSKEALLEDLTADELQHLMDLTMPISETEGSRSSCLALCTFVDKHRGTWTALLTGGASATVREAMMEAGREATKTQPHENDWLPVELGVVTSISTIIEVIIWWLRNPSTLTVQQAADIMHRLAIAPVTPR